MILIQSAPSAVDLQARLFRGFADPSRLSILTALRDGPQTVGALVKTTGLAQSNVSNHLGCLRSCGLVRAVPEGRFTRYALSDERVAALLEMADELLAEVALGVYNCTRYARDGEKPDA